MKLEPCDELKLIVELVEVGEMELLEADGEVDVIVERGELEKEPVKLDEPEGLEKAVKLEAV